MKITENEFQKIISSFGELHGKAQNIIKKCTRESLIEITSIKDISKIQSEIDSLYNKLEFAMTDSYHILGMIELPADRLAVFMKRFKILIHDRSQIKRSRVALLNYQTYLLSSDYQTADGSYTLKVISKDKNLTSVFDF